MPVFFPLYNPPLVRRVNVFLHRAVNAKILPPRVCAAQEFRENGIIATWQREFQRYGRANKYDERCMKRRNARLRRSS
jgi:hypothetical protein